jgi:hypothetical protein
MPVATARLAEVVATDLDPLEVGRRSQHPPQQLAVGGLGRGAFAQSPLRLSDPLGKGVPQALQLPEVEDPRLRRNGSHPVIDLGATKGLAEQPGELALESSDLAPQLVSGEALVDRGAWRR